MGALYPWLPVGSSQVVVRGDFELVLGLLMSKLQVFRCEIENHIIILLFTTLLVFFITFY